MINLVAENILPLKSTFRKKFTKGIISWLNFRNK